MVALVWDKVGTRYYESGVDRGVFYPTVGAGVPWSGLISVNEEPIGGEPLAVYLDGLKVSNISALEEFEATIESFSPPKEFLECDGMKQLQIGLYATSQPRKTFGFSYRTMIGNDTQGRKAFYKIHLVYNALAQPATITRKTYGDDPAAETMSWKITTLPPSASGYRPTAHFIVDTRYAPAAKVTSLENTLYGTVSTTPALITSASLINLFA